MIIHTSPRTTTPTNAMTTRVIRGTATALAIAGALGLLGLSAGPAAADSTVGVYGGRTTKFDCSMDRQKDIALYNMDGAGYFYSACVQAPDESLTGQQTTAGRWYFALRRHS